MKLRRIKRKARMIRVSRMDLDSLSDRKGEVHLEEDPDQDHKEILE